MPLDHVGLLHFCAAEGLFRVNDTVLLGGSAARSEAFNDIDLLVVSVRKPNLSARVLAWKGVRVEVFFHQLDALLSMVKTEAAAGRFGKASFVRDGTVLAGGCRGFSTLKLEVDRLQRVGPPEFRRSQAAFFFSERLIECEKAVARSDSMAAVLSLANGIEQSFHLARGEWLLTGKHFLRDVERNHPEFWSQFSTTFVRALSGDVTPFLAVVRHWADENCGTAPASLTFG